MRKGIPPGVDERRLGWALWRPIFDSADFDAEVD